MQNNLLRLCVVLSIFFTGVSGALAAPSLDDLVTAIVQYHPKVKALDAKGEQVGLERKRAQGAFDPVIEQQSRFSAGGYYDGQYLDQKLVQPLPELNAKVFGGYRISEGNFPEYNGEMRTLSGGEISAGASLSLLKNRDTDKRRIALKNAILDNSRWLSEQQLYLNELLHNGLTAYLDWYQTARVTGLLEGLVETTKARRVAISARIESGDLAKISLTEYQTTLVQREILLQQARRSEELAAQTLMYYWRTPFGEMKQVSALGKIPEQLRWPFGVDKQVFNKLYQAVETHPLLVALKADKLKEKNKLRLADNELLPEFDLSVKVSRDLGSGSETLEQTDTVIGLNFSVPFGQNTAKAEQARSKAKLRELELTYQVKKEQLSQELDQAKIAIDTSRQLIDLYQEQSVVANELMAQEMIRFEEGASDLFILNNREATAINARLSALDAEMDLYYLELNLWEVAGLLQSYLPANL